MSITNERPAKRAEFKGFYRNLNGEPDRYLTSVERGTPGGDFHRRFWQPVAYERELGKVPLRVRALGEDLVVFKNLKGDVGCLHLRCCHRNSSLEFGILTGDGIRCCYHGREYAVDGACIDIPGDPNAERIMQQVNQGGYPTEVYSGIVFIYMGPPDAIPVFPILDRFDVPGVRNVPGIRLDVNCNWLQMKENAVDRAPHGNPPHDSAHARRDGRDVRRRVWCVAGADVGGNTERLHVSRRAKSRRHGNGFDRRRSCTRTSTRLAPLSRTDAWQSTPAPHLSRCGRYRSIRNIAFNFTLATTLMVACLPKKRAPLEQFGQYHHGPFLRGSAVDPGRRRFTGKPRCDYRSLAGTVGHFGSWRDDVPQDDSPGIEAVAKGEHPPHGFYRDLADVPPTYANDYIVPVSGAGIDADDPAALRAFALEVWKKYQERSPMTDYRETSQVAR